MDVNVRPSPIAGLWYEGQPQALAREVNSYMDAAKLPPLSGQVIAVVAPHAGHRYSGPVAGYAFAAVRDSTPSVVAVLSPMHGMVPHPFIISAHAAYGTPLGNIQINRALINDLDARLKQRL